MIKLDISTKTAGLADAWRQKMKKYRKILLAALLAVIVLAAVCALYPKPEHLHVSRRTAISIALSKTELTRRDVYDLDTELDWQGSGNYPCYYIYFTYRDEDGQEVRVRCAVDGENSEFLGVERVE